MTPKSGGTILQIERCTNWEAVFEGRSDGKTDFQLTGWALISAGSPAIYSMEGIYVDPATGKLDLAENDPAFVTYRYSIPK